MSDTVEAKGRCLCGAVEVTAKKLSKSVGACHCSSCRRWGGGPFLAADAGADVSFKGEENISVYDSSDWAERGFCKKCGSHLFYRLKGMNKTILLSGLFGTDVDFTLDHQVFIDEKPGFYDFANETHNMTGAECFAAFEKAKGKGE